MNRRDISATPSTTPNRVTPPHNPNCVIPNLSVYHTLTGCNSRDSNVTRAQNGSTHDGQYATRFEHILFVYYIQRRRHRYQIIYLWKSIEVCSNYMYILRM